MEAGAGLRLLEVRDLRTAIETQRGTVYPVDGVGFELDEGETLAIVGESGSGKSMTALSLMGLLPKGIARVVGGTALLRGRDITRLAPRAMRELRGVEIAYMPQDPVSALNPALTIEHQVTESLLVHRKASRPEARSRALDLLGQMGIPNLPDALKAYPHQFSGGMRQRVLLAMALIGQPKVLIADEPTTSVDVTTQEQIIDLLWAIQRQTRLGIVLITHDLGVVARIATRVLVMYAGRSVEYGDADQIFERPMHPYTRGLLQSVAFDRLKPATRLYALSGNPPQLGELPSGCAFRPRCPYAVQVCFDVRPQLEKVPVGGGRSACHVAASGELPPHEIEAEPWHS
jgi:oligopeptide/dipeptide ABC transporter ATP-binding protein